NRRHERGGQRARTSPGGAEGARCRSVDRFIPGVGDSAGNRARVLRERMHEHTESTDKLSESSAFEIRAGRGCISYHTRSRGAARWQTGRICDRIRWTQSDYVSSRWTYGSGTGRLESSSSGRAAVEPDAFLHRFGTILLDHPSRGRAKGPTFRGADD